MRETHLNCNDQITGETKAQIYIYLDNKLNFQFQEWAAFYLIVGHKGSMELPK